MVKESQPTIIDHIEKIISGVKAHYAYPIEYEIALRRRDEVERIINRVVKVKEKAQGIAEKIRYIEETIYDSYLNPLLVKIFSSFIPWRILQDLMVGEYGVLTLGLRYAVALILPIVTFFFLVFSVIEDTGYLPRLAMLIDRTFKKIGLSGRAVIPMVLGFGCATMATLVTRTLPTKRERLIATMLLALAVPCSAQLS